MGNDIEAATERPNAAKRRARRQRLARSLMPRVITSGLVAGVAPLVTYLVVRPQVHGVATALAITFAVPVLWAALSAVVRARLDLDGILTIGAYGLGLVLTLISGGGALPLELRSAVETATIGTACLVSVALRRPLLLLGVRIMASPQGRRRDVWRATQPKPGLLPSLSLLTALVGIGFLVEAASQVALALVLPTVAFVALSLPTRFAIYGGEAAILLNLRALRLHRAKRP